jgi:hypothetical protein
MRPPPMSFILCQFLNIMSAQAMIVASTLWYCLDESVSEGIL